MRKPAGLQQFWGQRFRLRLLDLRFDSTRKFRCSALCIAPRCNKIGALPQLLFLGGCTKLETLAFQARILDHSTLTARHCSYCKCNSRAQEEVGGDSNPICAEPNYRPGSATPCILPCWNTALHYEACESFFSSRTGDGEACVWCKWFRGCGSWMAPQFKKHSEWFRMVVLPCAASSSYACASLLQESQQVDICSRADSDRLRHPSSQLLDAPWSTRKLWCP